MKSEPIRRNSLKDNRPDGRTLDGRMDAGASPHHTMISARSTLAELKNGLEIWWTATFPQKLALICLMVSEKMRFTDGWTDRRTTTDDRRPRHGISSADTVTWSYKLDFLKVTNGFKCLTVGDLHFPPPLSSGLPPLLVSTQCMKQREWLIQYQPTFIHVYHCIGFHIIQE